MLLTALIFGLLGSFHCVGMCGPIAFMLPVSRDNPMKKCLQVSLYHAGRLFAYSSIGLAFGVVGKSLDLFGFQQQVSIFTGLLMIAVILLPINKLSSYKVSTPLVKLIGRVKTSMGAALHKRSLDTFFTIGFLNGFLPCGLLYMAVLGALATGSILKGSLYMALFGLGTIPLMTLAIYFSGILQSINRKKVKQLIPVFVVVVGILFIIRGLGLGIPYISPAPVTALVSSSMECH